MKPINFKNSSAASLFRSRSVYSTVCPGQRSHSYISSDQLEDTRSQHSVANERKRHAVKGSFGRQVVFLFYRRLENQKKTCKEFRYNADNVFLITLRWMIHPHTVNAFYDRVTNKISKYLLTCRNETERLLCKSMAAWCSWSVLRS